MAHRNWTRSACLAALALAIAGTPAAWGQEDRPLLSGPRVAIPDEAEGGGGMMAPEAMEKADAIFRWTFEGSLERPDGLPEIAALELLSLTDEERAAVEDVLTARAGVVDKIVLDNLEVVSKLQGLGQQPADATARAERRETFRAITRAVAPLRERGSLRDEIEKALPAGQVERFESLLDDYAAAVREEAEKASEGESSEMSRADARRLANRERFRSTGVELAQGLQRVIGQQADDFEAFIGALGVTPEQEGEIRVLVQDLASRTGYDASVSETRRVLRQVYQMLDAEQRVRFMELVRERGGR